MTNLNQLPTDLPIPHDDGSTHHLKGMKIPPVALKATNGKTINLGEIKGKLVIYCYPMTGQPNVALPDGWDQIPGARGCTPQSCSFRDHYQELQALGAEVVGLSVQSTDYQNMISLYSARGQAGQLSFAGSAARRAGGILAGATLSQGAIQGYKTIKS
jgi:hypothetical protein